MKSERLERTLEYLKSEFFAAGEEWKDSKDTELLSELHALVGAINEIEVFLFDKRITNILDID